MTVWRPFKVSLRPEKGPIYQQLWKGFIRQELPKQLTLLLLIKMSLLNAIKGFLNPSGKAKGLPGRQLHSIPSPNSCFNLQQAFCSSPSHPAQSRDFARYFWFSYSEGNAQSCFSVFALKDTTPEFLTSKIFSCLQLDYWLSSMSGSHNFRYLRLQDTHSCTICWVFFIANTVRWTLGNYNFCLQVWTELKSPLGSALLSSAHRGTGHSFFMFAGCLELSVCKICLGKKRSSLGWM